MESKLEFVIRMLRELQKDYTEQYPEEIPDIELVAGIIDFDIRCSFSQQEVQE